MEVKRNEVGMGFGTPEERLCRRVVIYSPARTATQQGSGKVGKWKINFMSTRKLSRMQTTSKWKGPVMSED